MSVLECGYLQGFNPNVSCDGIELQNESGDKLIMQGISSFMSCMLSIDLIGGVTDVFCRYQVSKQFSFAEHWQLSRLPPPLPPATAGWGLIPADQEVSIQNKNKYSIVRWASGHLVLLTSAPQMLHCALSGHLLVFQTVELILYSAHTEGHGSKGRDLISNKHTILMVSNSKKMKITCIYQPNGASWSLSQEMIIDSIGLRQGTRIHVQKFFR